MIGGTVFYGDLCACGSPTEWVAGYNPDPSDVVDTGRAATCARSGNLLGAAVPPDRCVCGGPEKRTQPAAPVGPLSQQPDRVRTKIRIKNSSVLKEG